MSASESELVALARAGNAEAFDELVGLHQGRVYALAHRMLGNEEDARDVQQETFIRAWRKLGQFRLDAAFSTWLHRITMNLCISRNRRESRGPARVIWEDGIGSPAPATGTDGPEIAECVRKVLCGLPGHHRVLIVLRDMENRPYEEIAQLLGCSVASARSRLCKARNLLRERLRPYLAEEET